MHRRTGTERGKKLKRTKEVIDTEEEAKMEKEKSFIIIILFKFYENVKGICNY